MQVNSAPLSLIKQDVDQTKKKHLKHNLTHPQMVSVVLGSSYDSVIYLML